MTKRIVTPLAQFARRVPQAGRLRYGVKTDRAMKSLQHWRITSPDKDQIERLAERYGGTPRAWSPGRGRNEWEVLTESDVLDVVVPPNALGNTPIYEMWTAAGLQRRCDGVVLSIPTQTPDGAIVVEQPCICEQKGQMVCKPITRLNVLLPDLPFTGVWMMEAKGWNAAHELPGMVEMVVAIQDQGFARAILALEQRTRTEKGKTTHFMVPVLRTPATLNELAEGGARLMSIAAGDTPALPAASTPDDDEVVEAEIVEEPNETDLLIRTIYGHVATLQLTTPDLEGFCFTVSDGTVSDVRRLDYGQLRRVVAALERIINGDAVYGGLEGRRAVLLVPKGTT